MELIVEKLYKLEMSSYQKIKLEHKKTYLTSGLSIDSYELNIEGMTANFNSVYSLEYYINLLLKGCENVSK